MKAIVKTGSDKGEVSIQDIPKPTIGEHEVLVQIHTVGVCGSDVGAYLGKPEYENLSLPSTLGHEFSGIIRETGKKVSSVTPGNHVVVWPGEFCGKCFHCQNGQRNICSQKEVAVGSGGFAPFSKVTENTVHVVPNDLSLKLAALTEPLAVAFRAVMQNESIDIGDSLLIQGPGPMGAFSALIARERGAEVVVTGLQEDKKRLELLSDMGFKTMYSSEINFHNISVPFMDSSGFDVTIDATGNTAAIHDSLNATRSGGTVVVLGIPSTELNLDVRSLVRSEKHLLTSYSSTSRDFASVLRLLSKGRLDVEQLIDERSSLDDLLDSFSEFAQGDIIKPVYSFKDTKL